MSMFCCLSFISSSFSSHIAALWLTVGYSAMGWVLWLPGEWCEGWVEWEGKGGEGDDEAGAIKEGSQTVAVEMKEVNETAT